MKAVFSLLGASPWVFFGAASPGILSTLSFQLAWKNAPFPPPRLNLNDKTYCSFF